jgi:hypothetical protein
VPESEEPVGIVVLSFQDDDLVAVHRLPHGTHVLVRGRVEVLDDDTDAVLRGDQHPVCSLAVLT